MFFLPFFLLVGIFNEKSSIQYYCFIFINSVISFIYPSIVSFRVNHLIFGSYFLWVLYASTGIVFFNNILKKINSKLFPFTIIGQTSLYWFISHWFILEILSLICNTFFTTSIKNRYC